MRWKAKSGEVANWASRRLAGTLVASLSEVQMRAPSRHPYRPEVTRARDLKSVADAVRTAAASGVGGAVGWAFFGDGSVSNGVTGLELGIMVAISMFLAITWAATVGTFVPMLFNAIGADPALASGPLTTMLNDVFGLIIYLGLATLLLRTLGS